MWIPQFKVNQALVAAVGLSASLTTAAAEKFALGVCETARLNYPANIYPVYDAESYFYKYHKGLFKDNSLEGAKVTMLVPPKHGTLEKLAPEDERSQYNYLPQAGFEGTDRFVMQVQKAGIKLRIYYVIKALDDVEAVPGNCPKEWWKISSTTPDGTPVFSSDGTSFVGASEYAYPINLTGYNYLPPTITFRDLTGSAE